ncbi:MAG: hypothetical protein GY791_09265 [Alphaproteobacteria bacterium]|nr:hypothetical protein [Alphaproteobacteria bacterium]
MSGYSRSMFWRAPLPLIALFALAGCSVVSTAGSVVGTGVEIVGDIVGTAVDVTTDAIAGDDADDDSDDRAPEVQPVDRDDQKPPDGPGE